MRNGRAVERHGRIPSPSRAADVGESWLTGVRHRGSFRPGLGDWIA